MKQSLAVKNFLGISKNLKKSVQTQRMCSLLPLSLYSISVNTNFTSLNIFYSRFFKPKTEFDSLDLIDETEERESILGQIKKLGNNIKELATEIKTELHETVTYEGISYIEKMKKDISKSMFKAQKERRQYSESVESSRPSSVQSNSSLTSIKKSPPTSDRASLVFTPLATEHTPIATTETANEAVSRVPTKIKISEDVAELDGNKVPPSTRVTAPTKSILKKKNETEGEQESAIQEDK